MESEEQRNKFITSLSSFLSVTKPKVVGCIWVSNGALSERGKPFEWFNYLLDGVLESQIHHFPAQEKSIYKTDQFGRSFYLLHIQDSYTQVEKAYQDFMTILKQESSIEEGSQDNPQRPQVLLLTEKPQFFSQSLKKRNSNFEHLEYLY